MQKNIMKTRIGKNYSYGWQVVALLLISTLAFSGCGQSTTSKERRITNAEADLNLHPLRTVQFTAPLGEAEVVAFVLQHNLEAKLQEREIAIQRELQTGAWLKLLPSLTANYDYTKDSQYSASSSINLETGEASLTNSYSAEKESEKYGLSAVFNVLDFGMSYYLARQASSQTAITELQFQRTRQNLALDASRLYWRCIVTREAAQQALDFITEIKTRQEKLVQRLEDQTIERSTGLAQRKKLMDLAMQLQAFVQDWEGSRTELGRLMGLDPNTKFELAAVEVPFITEYEKYNVQALEEEAVLSRPELYQEDLQEGISQYNARIAILRMLPSPGLLLRHNWDDNPHLNSNYWYTTGVNASWDLLSIPQHYLTHQAENLRTEFIKERRMAVAVGILTQLHMTLIQYQTAAERCLATAEINRVQQELVEVTEQLVSGGKETTALLLMKRIDKFLAHSAYRQAYADLQVLTAQIANVVGRNPEISVSQMPADMLAGTATTRILQSPVATTPEGALGEAGLGMTPPRIIPPQAPAGVNLALMEVAKEMENKDFRKAKEAQEKLLGSGEAGAAAALEMLNSDNSLTRILAIKVVRENGTSRMVASLLPALSDEDQRIRYHASMAIKDAFQQDFGYDCDARKEVREEAIERWRNYLFSAPVEEVVAEEQPAS
ncbi:MAG: TolC family protein [Planctomycetes bacterium]|nr:TolC family protein [Planctomycetota bacterium]